MLKKLYFVVILCSVYLLVIFSSSLSLSLTFDCNDFLNKSKLLIHDQHSKIYYVIIFYGQCLIWSEELIWWLEGLKKSL